MLWVSEDLPFSQFVLLENVLIDLHGASFGAVLDENAFSQILQRTFFTRAQRAYQ